MSTINECEEIKNMKTENSPDEEINSKNSDYSPEHAEKNDEIIKESISYKTSDRNGVVKLRTTSDDDVGVMETLPVYFLKQFECFSTRIAHKYEKNGVFISMSYEQYKDLVFKVAKSLISLKLQNHSSVAILSLNRPEWLYMFIGAVFGGCLPSSIYTTNTPDIVEKILNKNEAPVLLIDQDKQLEKIVSIGDKLLHLKYLVVLDDNVSFDMNKVFEFKIIKFREFLELGKDVSDDAVMEIVKKQQPNECCSICYTSGTTATVPKGAMISHDSMVYISKLANSAFPDIFGNMEFHQIVSFLPLSHVAAQGTDILLAAQIGATVWFVGPDAFKGGLKRTLLAARPTVFFSVPRVFEKFINGINENIDNSNYFIRSLSKASLEAVENHRKNKKSKFPLALAKFMTNLIRKKIGLDRVESAIVGAAPASDHLIDSVANLGISLNQSYGLTETTGPITGARFSNPNERYTLGKPIPGTLIKIYQPNDHREGEITIYGRSVLMGYLNDPEETNNSIDDDGYFHTGDIGKFDENGNILITGRIKEILITSGGENVPPVYLETSLKENLEFICDIMLIGDNKPFVAVLLTFKVDVNTETLYPTDNLSEFCIKLLKQIGVTGFTSAKQLAKSPPEALVKAIESGIEKTNAIAISNAQRIRKFILLERAFSLPGGELGPTMKLKRSEVLKMYHTEIEDMYTQALNSRSSETH